MTDGRDPLVSLRQALDQQGASLSEMSPMLRTFHQSLVNAGFLDDQAMVLTSMYFSSMLAMGRSLL